MSMGEFSVRRRQKLRHWAEVPYGELAGIWPETLPSHTSQAIQQTLSVLLNTMSHPACLPPQHLNVYPLPRAALQP